MCPDFSGLFLCATTKIGKSHAHVIKQVIANVFNSKDLLLSTIKIAIILRR